MIGGTTGKIMKDKHEDRCYDPETLKKLQSVELEILRDFVELCDSHGITYFGIAGTGIGALRHGGFIPWDDDIDVAMPREDYDKFISAAESEKKYTDKYFVMDGKRFPGYPLLTTRWVMKGTEFVEWPLKDIDLPFGIFLDIYPLDQIPDDERKFRRQARQAFFWSKLLVLRCVPHPVLPVGGFKAQVIQVICGMIHTVLKVFRVSREWLFNRCLAVSTKYNGRGKTGRIDFLCDTTAYMNIHYIEDIYPLKKIRFEDIDLNFPNRIENNLEREYGDYMTLPPEDKRRNHCPYKLKFKEE